MSLQHKELALGRWNELSLVEQMANIGSEIERALKWRSKNNSEYCMGAFERALELLDMTLDGHKKKAHLKEIARTREVLVDFFLVQTILCHPPILCGHIFCNSPAQREKADKK